MVPLPFTFHCARFGHRALAVAFTWVLLLLYSCQDSSKDDDGLPIRDTSTISIEIGKLARPPIILEGAIGPGQGLFQALGGLGVSLQPSLAIVRAISDSVELIRLKVGEPIRVGFDPSDSSKLVLFEYSPNPSLTHRLHADPKGNLIYERDQQPLEERITIIDGEIQEGTTLDRELRALGVRPTMVGVVTGVLLCKIAFSSHARAKDKFRVLLKETFYKNQWIDGSVLYTSYDGKLTKKHEAFRYDDGDPKSSFNAHYTEDGEALVYSGLRYPLDRLHISSPFGWRVHPVTGRRQMHDGVDYSVPTGSPVYAVAEGTVVQAAYTEYGGNQVAIRHADKYTSFYLHNSKLLVHAGQRVAPRQIIARSGNTGRSTGPHLHFAFKTPAGAWMNPLMKRMIATPKLEGEKLQKLKGQIAEIRKLISKTEKKKT